MSISVLRPDFIAHSHVQDAYLGKLASQLTSVTSEQMQEIYALRGLVIPVLVSSVLHYVFKHELASLSDIARALGLQHQLVAQRVKKLQSLDLIEKQPDPDDARRTQYSLTEAGREQAQLLVECMEDTAVVYRALFKEIDCDLIAALSAAIDAVREKPLTVRFADEFATGETQ